MQLLNYCFDRLNRGRGRIFAAVTVAGLGSFAAQCASALVAPAASGTVTTVATGALNTYALSLTDAANSASPIGSVWEAWIPGAFYMTSLPTSVTAPTGWTSNVTPGNPGYGIQWVASASNFDVPIGGSLSGFGFQSPDSPVNIYGTSTVPNDAGIPTLTSVAYAGGLFSPPTGTTFVFTAVPEPVSLALLMPAALFLRRRSRRLV